jgi:uncharacterized protein YndB with AHSA1/START domain
MTESDDTVMVRVSHRFDASAERVYDAFLDPGRADKFLFATATGQIVRCEIDARAGGGFTIVDRRNGEDVAHTGKYLELDRPRRLVFAFSVEKYSTDADVVTIDIRQLNRGCELTLTHTTKARYEEFRNRVRQGWTDILEVAAELLVDEAPTCGIGIAQHAAIPAKIAVLFEGLAETLELHRRMLTLEDENAREEDRVYRDLAASWEQIATLVANAASQMAAQRELPMGAHDETAWGGEHVSAFEKFVNAESRLLALLRIAVGRDEAMLASVKRSG